MVYAGLGQEAPSDFDETIFDLIYYKLRLTRTLSFTSKEESDLWAPVITRVQRMMGEPTADAQGQQTIGEPIQIPPLPLEDVIDVDILMGDDSDEDVFDVDDFDGE